MPLRLVPGGRDYFEMFSEMAAKVDEGAQELLILLKGFDRVGEHVQKVLDIEHEGDELTHEIVRRINTTFVGPLDREDIHGLASALDDVLDEIEAAAENVSLFKLSEPLPQMISLAETLARGTAMTAKAIPQLRKLKTHKDALNQYFHAIDELEDEGDRLYSRTSAHLYGGEFKAMDVLRYEDIVKSIEAAIDRLEDVANTVEGIATKTA